jgi:O-antigen/teichoic acid export membrane protein
MWSSIKSIFVSEFVRNVATLATGTTLAQAIPIAISPILTRIYTPEDFGILSLFMAMTAILGSICNGKYELAILLPKSAHEALNIVFLSIIISTSFSAILLVLVLFFRYSIAQMIGNPEVAHWLFLIPFSVFFIGIYNAFNLFNTREKNFRSVALSSIYKSAGSGTTQLSLGFMGIGTFGLIAGQIMSYVSGNYILLKRILEKYKLRSTFSWQIIGTMAKGFTRFPQFTLPSSLLNATNLNLINFLISGLFSTTVLGFYSLAQRMLGVPSVVIGRSIGQVYFQKITETKNKDGNVCLVFKNTLKKLCIVSIPIFSIAYFTVCPIFIVVFGNEWETAGIYAKILIPLIAIRFVSSPLSTTTHVFQKQHYSLIINSILIITVLSLFYFSRILDVTFENLLRWYAYILLLEYIVFLYAYWRITKGHFEKEN